MFQTSNCIRVVIVSFIVCLIAGTGIAQTTTPDLPEGYDWKYNPNNGHYYTSIVQPVLHWNEAINFAENLGGYLVTITSETEQQWIESNSLVGGWLGLQKINSEWYWITGESLTYTNWMSGEPTGDGPIVELRGYEWNDRPDNKLNEFIVEIDDPESPTPTPTPTQPPDLPEDYDWEYNPDNGHYYAYVNESKSWGDAKTFSESLGGYLVTITSREENYWVVSTFEDFYNGGNDYRIYIGLYYENEQWHWVNGELSSYRNFANLRTIEEEWYMYVNFNKMSFLQNASRNEISRGDFLNNFFIFEDD